jgi:16S rRNA (adenine1518-N6/adenine1519-N6)-dimethyltransferase
MRARKRFGQNFLVDTQVVEQILSAVSAQPSDHVVEIGPGHGAITTGLAASGARLTLIEIDRDLIAGLIAGVVCRDPDRITLINQDVLTVDFRQLTGPLRIVGNLPYNISTPVLFQLLDATDWIQDIHVMLQKEVVQRITAVAGDPAYGRLGVMISAVADTEALIDVPPESFQPAPKVDSGVVRIRPNAARRAAIVNIEHLGWLVRTAFHQRRKTLRNNLKEFVSAELFASLGIDPGARPETLPVESFITLSNTLVENPNVS